MKKHKIEDMVHKEAHELAHLETREMKKLFESDKVSFDVQKELDHYTHEVEGDHIVFRESLERCSALAKKQFVANSVVHELCHIALSEDLRIETFHYRGREGRAFVFVGSPKEVDMGDRTMPGHSLNPKADVDEELHVFAMEHNVWRDIVGWHFSPTDIYNFTNSFDLPRTFSLDDFLSLCDRRDRSSDVFIEKVSERLKQMTEHILK